MLYLFLGNKSSSVKMSSAPEPPAFKKEPPKEKDFQNPGLRGVQTTTLFRAVNPELFIKPVRDTLRIRFHVSLSEAVINRKLLFPVTLNFIIGILC